MKFSYKGMLLEIDHATFVAIISGVIMYIKALFIDYLLGKNKNLQSNSMVELVQNKIRGDKL